MSGPGRQCCILAPLFVVSLAGLVLASALLYSYIDGMLYHGASYGTEAYIIVAAMYIGSALLLIFSWKRYRLEQLREKIVGIARGYDRITFDEMGKISGRPPSMIRDVVFSAISAGALAGTIQGDTFIRTAPTKGTVAVEREVMVTRRAPERCYKCNADINPQQVEWVGPDSVRCPHCGATLSVKTERI